jgi:hypothetical protein
MQRLIDANRFVGDLFDAGGNVAHLRCQLVKLSIGVGTGPSIGLQKGPL